MKRIVIETFVDLDEFQPKLLSNRTTTSIFYSIGAISDFFNDEGRIIGSEINCYGAIYFSPMSKKEVDELVMFNKEEL